MPSYTAHGLILLAAALLSGCIVPERLLLAYIDSDHDGHYEAGFPGSRTWDPGYDCDDNDPAIHDDRPELCGDRVDNDCDGEVDEDGVGDIAVWYDLDKDGFGDPDAESTKCEPNVDWVLNEEDCDDQNNSINPLMNERCDGIDEDCDGVIDNDAPETPWYRDADGDSFGSSVSVLQSCQAPEGYVPNPDDCDDEDPAVYPAADDAPYDGIDADCFRDSDYDVDGDGFFHASRGSTLVDCDDVEPSIHPGSPEIWYDGVDQDCNPDTEWDADRDGFSAAPMGDDCDDASPFIYPSAREVWYDRIDQDCDPATEWDQDGDGLTVAGAPEGSADDCNDDCKTSESAG